MSTRFKHPCLQYLPSAECIPCRQSKDFPASIFRTLSGKPMPVSAERNASGRHCGRGISPG
ncbi:MAG: hypothetical protein IKO95_03890 [Spirochaetia bacterium]|nr:hypothetical protein [Spirochaetia bacterium]